MKKASVSMVRRGDVSYAEPLLVRKVRKEKIARELERISKRDGRLLPARLVEEARDPASPLHQFFEWSDSVAGAKWRIEQARALVCAQRYVVEHPSATSVPKGLFGKAAKGVERQVRRYVHIAQHEGYMERAAALSDAEIRTATVEHHRGQLRAWCREVSDLGELDELRKAIERLL